ncbi:hypothetical protein Gohar_013822, partial [Gossypium harknessii]|nr:hypothetical protein [Gossypium harknessii]
EKDKSFSISSILKTEGAPKPEILDRRPESGSIPVRNGRFFSDGISNLDRRKAFIYVCTFKMWIINEVNWVVFVVLNCSQCELWHFGSFREFMVFVVVCCKPDLELILEALHYDA